MSDKKRRILIGISGASGAVYGIEMIKLLKALKIETHLVVSKAAEMTIAYETDLTPKQVKSMADVTYSVGDLGAACSSGSFHLDGMVIAPCSMKTLAEIATGVTSSLLTRSADVMLKERRRLVLMVRETPLTNVHLRNMLTVSEMGGIIAPPAPAHYIRPDSVDDLVNHSIGRVLDLFDIDTGNLKRWTGSPDA